MHLHDQEKTTSTCPYGTFTYSKMPFRLCDTPATFQQCMTAMSSGFIDSIMDVVIDDFFVCRGTFDLCLENLTKVLCRCEKVNLVLNWKKCHFMV